MDILEFMQKDTLLINFFQISNIIIINDITFIFKAFMKKTVFIFIIILFTFVNIQSQIKYFQELIEYNNTYLLDTSITSLYKHCRFIIHDNKIAYINANTDYKDSLCYYYLNYPETKQIVPIIQKCSNVDEKCFIKNFKIIDNKLYILYYEYITVFSKDSNCYNYDTTINFYKKPFQYIKLHNNNLILYGINPNAQPNIINGVPEPRIIITYYNINTKKITEKSIPDNNEPNWMFIQPRKLIDYSNNKFIVSNAQSYSIKIYNDSTNEISEISRKPKDWIEYDNENKKQMSMLSYWNKISLIRSIDFINDKKFIVMRTSPSNTIKPMLKSYCDIWEFKNNSWELTQQDYEIAPYIDTALFNIINHIHYSDAFYFDDNYMLIALSFSIELTEDFQNYTNKEIIEKKKDYLLNHDTRYSIIKARIK